MRSEEITAVKWAAICEHPVKPAATCILLHVCLWYYGTETQSDQKADEDLYFSSYEWNVPQTTNDKRYWTYYVQIY